MADPTQLETVSLAQDLKKIDVESPNNLPAELAFFHHASPATLRRVLDFARVPCGQDVLTVNLYRTLYRLRRVDEDEQTYLCHVTDQETLRGPNPYSIITQICKFYKDKQMSPAGRGAHNIFYKGRSLKSYKDSLLISSTKERILSAYPKVRGVKMSPPGGKSRHFIVLVPPSEVMECKASIPLQVDEYDAQRAFDTGSTRVFVHSPKTFQRSLVALPQSSQKR